MNGTRLETAEATAEKAAAPRPEIVPPRPPPGPVAAAAEVKAAAVERELGMLAVELGAGRDTALLRALAFYRKFVRRGRRYGRAPEAFLKELLDAFEHRDLHAELAQIRRNMAAIAEKAPALVGAAQAFAAGRPVPLREPTPLEVYRAAKTGRALPRGVVGGPDDPGTAGAASADAAGQRLGPGNGNGTPPLSGALAAARVAGIGVIHDGSRLAGVPAPALAELAPIPAPPIPDPQAKSDYADRRARLPKITF